MPGAARDALRADLDGQDPAAALEWFRLRRDSYVPATAWNALSDSAKLLVQMHVVAMSSPVDRVNSHCSAATAQGIPIIGPLPAHVELTVPDNRTGRAAGVVRHRSQNCPEGVLHNGILVTPPARTAVDLARVRSLASGVAALDHVLHHKMASREELIREQEAIPKRGRGRQRARLAIALADGAAESAGESLSRIRLYELGYPKPTLQHEFYDDRGSFVGRTDMYWRQHKTVGEFDGRMKYRVEEAGDPEEAGRILWREKQREDALRRLDLTVARWVWDDAIRPDRLRAVLTAYGLRPEADPSWLERL